VSIVRTDPSGPLGNESLRPITCNSRAEDERSGTASAKAFRHDISITQKITNRYQNVTALRFPRSA
jgi:hypothetical protein